MSLFGTIFIELGTNFKLKGKWMLWRENTKPSIAIKIEQIFRYRFWSQLIPRVMKREHISVHVIESITWKQMYKQKLVASKQIILMQLYQFHIFLNQISVFSIDWFGMLWCCVLFEDFWDFHLISSHLFIITYIILYHSTFDGLHRMKMFEPRWRWWKIT